MTGICNIYLIVKGKLSMEKHPLDLILQLTDSGFFHNRYRNDRASCFFL